MSQCQCVTTAVANYDYNYDCQRTIAVDIFVRVLRAAGAASSDFLISWLARRAHTDRSRSGYTVCAGTYRALQALVSVRRCRLVCVTKA